MTHLLQEYWEWNEELNDTPYKLGSDINDLLQKGLVFPSIDEANKFLGNAKGAPRDVEVIDGKITLVFFSSVRKSTFPSISEGLWDMEERDFIKTLSKLLKKTTGPISANNLFVLFRGGFVAFAMIFRKQKPSLHYDNVIDQEAFIFKSTLRDNTYEDGNKSTAVDRFKHFANKNGIKINLSDSQLLDIAKQVVTKQLDDVHQIGAALTE